MNFVRRNIMTAMSCRKMHEHDFFNMSWRYSPRHNPLGVSLKTITGDNFVWELPVEDLMHHITPLMPPGVKYQVGVATFRRRASMHDALTIKLPTPPPPIEVAADHMPPFLYFICSLTDVVSFLNATSKIACELDVDKLIKELLS